jgi:hypothetical protein
MPTGKSSCPQSDGRSFAGGGREASPAPQPRVSSSPRAVTVMASLVGVGVEPSRLPGVLLRAELPGVRIRRNRLGEGVLHSESTVRAPESSSALPASAHSQPPT